MCQWNLTETQVVLILEEADTGVPSTKFGGVSTSVHNLLLRYMTLTSKQALAILPESPRICALLIHFYN